MSLNLSSGFGIWSEFLPYEQVQAFLPQLKAYQAELYLAIHSDYSDSNALIQLFHSAKELQIPIYPWILLSDEDGYWSNALNVDKVIEHIQSFVAWAEKEGLIFNWLIIDMEPPLKDSDFINQIFQKKQPWKLWKHFRSSRSTIQFSYAVEQYNSLINFLHKKNCQVMVVSFPMVLDDKDLKLQQILHTPISPIHWDKISFLLYRTILSNLSRLPLTSGIISSYLHDAQRKFHCPIAADLGVIGNIEKIPSGQGYIHIHPLSQDISATRASGTLDFHLFSLDGMQQFQLMNDWFLSSQSAGKVFQPNWADILFRKTIQSAIKIM